jgi:hypothetical protein
MLGGGFGLGEGVLEADGRVLLLVSLRGPTTDPDGDRLFGDDDGCPKHAEDFDLYRDDDGCPEPDNDGDGVLDARDACPDDAGDPGAQGCPQPRSTEQP